MTGVAILGSTGSIGTRALEVIRELGPEYKVTGIAAGRNKELALEQVKQFAPEVVSLAGEEEARWLKNNLPERGTEVVWGKDGLITAATLDATDIVLTAVSGAVGISPSVEALKAGKDLALANKETLVAAGPLVMQLAREKGRRIMPVDSEHSAIWQCLWGENRDDVDKIILTASGGPFRNYTLQDLQEVTPEKALKHPNWDMGAKITIDSATLMNKGLEVIEARWLFDVNYDHIEVVIHPQSIVHSMVEFIDGSIIAQLGAPDMKLPIQCALTYPGRFRGAAPRLPRPFCDLTFETPGWERFPCLEAAYRAGKKGGTMPAVLNAANEIAVSEFLAGRISFMEIPAVLDSVMGKHSIISEPSLQNIFAVDKWAREEALNYCIN